MGAILIALITIAVSVAYATYSAQQASQQTMSVTDLIRAAERRQSQLLSLTYCYKQGNRLRLYLYNYGTQESTPKLILVNGQVVSNPAMKDVSTGDACDTIAPRSLVELTLQAFGSSPFEVVVLTEQGAVYSWKLTL